MVTLTACAGTRPAPLSPTGGVLLPGASELAKVRFQDEPVQYHMIADRLPNGDSVYRDLGILRKEFLTTTYDGTPAILIVIAQSYGKRSFLDSSLVRRDGLAPVWEVSRIDNRRIRFDYDSSRVRREVTAPDSAVAKGEGTYPFPVFTFNELDELIRSVPLRMGYHAILPLYSEGDNALETDTVRVEGRDSAGVWNVRFADKVIVSHYGIDGSTRSIVRFEVERHADRARFRYVIQPGASPK